MKSRGFSLVEVIVGVALLAIVSLSVYQAYASVMTLTRGTGDKLAATLLANEQIEILRNLPYQSVGVVDGVPNGVLEATTTAVRDGKTFQMVTTIRNIDDPFDGSFPTDTAPADYKLAEVVVACATCTNFSPISLTTTVAPKNAENLTNNGGLYVTVRDATAAPVQGAQVSIVNSAVSPAVNFSDVTDINGTLKLFDIPPASLSYVLTATKLGYSTDGTYEPTTVNPSPYVLPSTVAAGKATSITFYIDKFSSLALSSVNSSCAVVPSYKFKLQGNKTIGVSVYKYSSTQTTTGVSVTVPNLEWDTYNISLPNPVDASYELAGTLPVEPIGLAPGTAQSVTLILEPKISGASLLAIVKDTATKLPVSGASVTLAQTSSAFSSTKTTGRGIIGQTNWSGGAGQAMFTDQTKFYDSDGNVDIGTTGQISLKKVVGNYVPSAWLTSSTFDLGTPASLYLLTWTPQDQPAGVGADSVKFQIASNNDNATWNYTGPDGTAATYYTGGIASVGSPHTDHRYFRYKMFLQTASPAVTPSVTDLQFQFTTACTPSGEVFWNGLTGGSSYSISIAAPGYDSISSFGVTVAPGWQEQTFYITPNL